MTRQRLAQLKLISEGKCAYCGRKRWKYDKQCCEGCRKRRRRLQQIKNGHKRNPRAYLENKESFIQKLKSLDWTKSNGALAKEFHVGKSTVADWRITVGAKPLKRGRPKKI